MRQCVRSAALVLLGFAACRGSPQTTPVDEPVATLAKLHPGWRVGRASDCTTKPCQDWIRENAGYHPYETRADLNLDGTEDLAVVLVKGDSGRIVWLPGMASGFGQAAELGVVDWVSRAGLFPGRGILSFGEFYSDVVFTWAWNPAARAMQLKPEEEPGIP